MGLSDLCERCSKEGEDITHAVRDCEVAQELWACVLPAEIKIEFFYMGIREWIVWLIRRGRKMGQHTRWAKKILIASWLQ